MTNDIAGTVRAFGQVDGQSIYPSGLLLGAIWLIGILVIVGCVVAGFMKKQRGLSTSFVSRVALAVSAGLFFVECGIVFWDWGMALAASDVKTMEVFTVFFYGALRCLAVNFILAGFGIGLGMIMRMEERA